jgi:hypothetical protein
MEASTLSKLNGIKKLALIGCVCILGLITYTVYISNPAPTASPVKGTMLFNGQPSNDLKAVLSFDDEHQETLNCDANGVFTKNVDLDSLVKIEILYKGKSISSSGPPFYSDADYGIRLEGTA